MKNLKLNDNGLLQLDIIHSLKSEIFILKDKLKRRGVQIADLKYRIKELKKYYIGNLSINDLKYNILNYLRNNTSLNGAEIMRLERELFKQ